MVVYYSEYFWMSGLCSLSRIPERILYRILDGGQSPDIHNTKCSTSDVYSGGTEFKSWGFTDCPDRGYLWFSLVSPGKCWDSVFI
jgi:hypothetical protein